MADYVPPYAGQVRLRFLGSGNYFAPWSQKVRIDFTPDTEPAGETQFVFPSGVAPGPAAGAEKVWLAVQFLQAVGLAAGGLGTPSVRNKWSFVRPTGISQPSLPANHRVSNFTRNLSLAGLDSAKFGTALVSNFSRYLQPAGIAATQFGSSIIFLRNRNIFVPGIFAFQGGNHEVKNAAQAFVFGGLAASSLGQHRVGMARRFVYPSGISGGSYGLAWVSLKTRYLSPQGVLETKYGKPWVKWEDDAKLTNYALLLTM